MIGKTSAGTSAKEEKTVTAGTAQKVVIPSNGKLLSKVTINPTPSQAKTATPTAAQQTIKPDSGKLLSQVLVNAVPDSEKKGLYVWKKYQYTPAETVTNPSFTYNITKYSETVTISNENFDLTKVGENWIEFFNGFGNSSGNLEVKYGKLYHGNKIITAFDPVAKTFTVSDTWNSNSSSVYSYEGTKTLQKEQRVFLDYVVSDDETAYPDGGTQGGYWYEKVVEGVPLTGILGMQKIAVDYFTPTADTYLSGITLTHSLGAVPTTVFIMPVAKSYTLPADYNSYYILFHAFNAAKFISGATQWAMVREAIVGASLKCSMITSAQHSPEIVTSTQFKADTNSGTGGSYLKAGVEYAIITAA